MEMNPVWKKVLEEVGFISWYRALSDEFRTEPPFTDHSITEAQDMIMEFGFKKTHYDPKTSFYQVEGVDDTRVVKGLGSGVSVSLKDGALEVVVAFDIDNDTRVGGTFSLLPGMLGDTGSPVRKPAFTNYKELYSLLKKIFQKYDDIGNKVIDIYLAEPATM
jgi:hypothetical protein